MFICTHMETIICQHKILKLRRKVLLEKQNGTLQYFVSDTLNMQPLYISYKSLLDLGLIFLIFITLIVVKTSSFIQIGGNASISAFFIIYHIRKWFYWIKYKIRLNMEHILDENILEQLIKYRRKASVLTANFRYGCSIF